MKRTLLSLVGVVGTVAALGAHAQAMTAYGPDNGFFRPAPDVSLTAQRPAGSSPQATQQPFLTLSTPQVGSVVATPVPVPATVTVAAPATVNRVNPAVNNAAAINAVANSSLVAQPPSAAMSSTSAPMGMPQQPAAAAQALTEQQMDRSQNEADRARVQMQTTPPGVGAAFDGTTSAENR